MIICGYTSYSQIDSTYYINSKKILEKYPKSRIKAEDLYESAKKIYDEKGIIVPYKLAISQAIIETSLGNSGVGKNRNNPFSLNSKKGYKRYDQIKDGVIDYYYFVSNGYLRCKSINELLTNFTNCKGYRYAETRSYEAKLKRQYFAL